MLHAVEKIWDRLRPRAANPKPFIDPYIGYATPDACVLRGRVLNAHMFSRPLSDASTLNAVRNIVRLFLTDELPGVTVACRSATGVTDEEGYFTLPVPPAPAGTARFTVRLPSFDVEQDVIALVPAANAEFGIISDIDDTVMKTGAYSLARNLWTTATTFVSARIVFQDTAALIEKLHAGRNPVFYVSSSPWNMHAYLLRVFQDKGVPIGPMFLRDLGVSETQWIKTSHGRHKGEAIATILSANPDLKFTLIGDTGQHDAAVYLEAIRRHKGRIRQVILRNAGTADEDDAAHAAAIRQTGVDFFNGDDLTGLL